MNYQKLSLIKTRKEIKVDVEVVELMVTSGLVSKPFLAISVILTRHKPTGPASHVRSYAMITLPISIIH